MNKNEEDQYFLLSLESPKPPAPCLLGKASTCHSDRRKTEREKKKVSILAVISRRRRQNSKTGKMRLLLCLFI
jgi:hypothetical protein